MINHKNKFAFTLAEVLITIGIIGIVAALTLPSFIIKKTEKERTAQLKKVYSSLSQAYLQAVSEKGSPDEWGMLGMYDIESHYILATTFRKYMKLSKDCIDMSEANVQKYCKVINGLNVYTNARSFILMDGTIVTFRNYSGICNNNFAGLSGNNALKNVCGSIIVDINGNKLPNKNGEDKFTFFVTKYNIIPFGIKDSDLEFEKACNKSIPNPYPGYSSGNMYACTAWVIYNENMDYLHCDDLSWTGKQKCN